MNKQQQLIEAVKTENIHSINRLLLEDPSLAYATNEKGISIILQALYQGQRVIAEVLLVHKADPDIFEAAALGIHEAIQQNLAFKPQLVHAFSPDGFTALGLACYFGRPAIVELLLESGADPNIPSQNDLQAFPLHSAVAHRLPEIALIIVNILIKYSAKVNVCQKDGRTPLHQAAALGYAELVRLLLANGADKQAINIDNSTPIQMAKQNGYPEVVKLLK